MSRYTVLTILLLLSSIYPVSFVLEEVDDIWVVTLYALIAFVFSFALVRTFYTHCTTWKPMRYHLREMWFFYIVSVGIFMYYYIYLDRCFGGLCRDLTGMFWSLASTIPIWVHIGFLTIECASTKKHSHVVQILLLLGITVLGVGCSFFLLNLLYGQMTGLRT